MQAWSRLWSHWRWCSPAQVCPRRLPPHRLRQRRPPHDRVDADNRHQRGLHVATPKKPRKASSPPAKSKVRPATKPPKKKSSAKKAKSKAAAKRKAKKLTAPKPPKKTPGGLDPQAQRATETLASASTLKAAALGDASPANAPMITPLADASATTGTLTGTLTDAASSATLADVCVYLYATGGAYTGNGTCAAADGGYVLSNIPAGSYTLAAYDPAGWHPTTWYGGAPSQESAASFDIAGGASTSDVNISLPQLTGITGKVTDAVTEGTIPGACVYAKQTGGGSATYATCISGAEYTYAITGMDPGTYDVAFYDPSGMHHTMHVDATVTDGRTTTTVDGAMPEITGIIGTVVDASSGKPIANGCVMLYTTGGNYVAGSYRCTNATGTFVIDGVNPGTYALAYYDPAARFLTQWYSGQSTRKTAAAVVITNGVTTQVGPERVKIQGSITGIVRNADGSPAADVCVYADDLDGKYTGVGGCSDSTGRYTLYGLLAGGYKIAYYPPGTTGASTYWYLQAASEAAATPIAVDSFEPTNVADMYLVDPGDITPPGPVTNLAASSANTTVRLTLDQPHRLRLHRGCHPPRRRYDATLQPHRRHLGGHGHRAREHLRRHPGHRRNRLQLRPVRPRRHTQLRPGGHNDDHRGLHQRRRAPMRHHQRQHHLVTSHRAGLPTRLPSDRLAERDPDARTRHHHQGSPRVGPPRSGHVGVQRNSRPPSHPHLLPRRQRRR